MNLKHNFKAVLYKTAPLFLFQGINQFRIRLVPADSLSAKKYWNGNC